MLIIQEENLIDFQSNMIYLTHFLRISVFDHSLIGLKIN
jgi:hypothetical protein